MLLEFKLKLLTGYFGGGNKNSRGVRALEKAPNGDILIRTDNWQHKLKCAARDLGLEVNLEDSVKLPTQFIPPTIRILKRKFYNKGLKVDYFEGFGPNTEICIDFVFNENITKAPSMIDLKRIFQVMGNYYGISQFGSQKFGLGRFNVVYIKSKYENDAN